MERELSKVELSDGIDRAEAQAIAVLYWMGHRSIVCGGPDRPQRDGEWWRMAIKEGYAGERSPGTVWVHSRLGSIRSTFARPYRDPGHFHEWLVVAAR